MAKTPVSTASTAIRRSRQPTGIPGQVVLVLQGGGALGAYQLGVYEALHEAGIEPDWVIGTSIGAINGALIAGNRPEQRLERLQAFWDHVEQQGSVAGPLDWLGMGHWLANMTTVLRGIPAFFDAQPGGAARRAGARWASSTASYYSTAPLRDTLAELVDFDYLCDCHTRLTVGAVNASSGTMRYFDTRKEALGLDHVMASGALPPAFPAVRIDGEPYWDGGIYSNTPIEAVLDDKPRRDSLIFAVNVWHQTGPEPESIWQVMGRQKDIQYASRADSHIARQKQIHRLRHVIRELAQAGAGGQGGMNARSRSWRRGAAARRCTWRTWSRRASKARTTPRTSISPPPACARGATPACDDARRMIERAPWRAPMRPDRRRDRAPLKFRARCNGPISRAALRSTGSAGISLKAMPDGARRRCGPVHRATPDRSTPGRRRAFAGQTRNPI